MKYFLNLVCFCALGISVSAQQQRPQNSQNQKASAESVKSQSSATNLRVLAPESAVITNHTITIKGKSIPYKATAGTLPVWDNDGKAIAGLFYTYYERTDIQSKENRPLVISFNGGPGTASVWMHIGYTGPYVLNIDDEGNPIQPYGYKENSNSLLDVADIVYIDPINTGYSRVTDKDTKADRFFGVRNDIKYLAEWINTFVTRNNRWASPKYLIGESYGTTRVSGLALELQSTHWMYLNGVILVSPTDLGIERGGAMSAALRLPYFAATAWYHKALATNLQAKKLSDFLPDVEQFTLNQLLPAMAKGNTLTVEEKNKIAKLMAVYSGISEKTILQNNLNVSPNFFWKELLRDKGFTIGRLDSRYKGIDKTDAGSGPDFNAELTSWLHSFTPAINMYLRNELNYKTDLKYNMFGFVYPWDNTGNNVAENLRAAMAQNPYLHLLVQSGYFDGACDYFNAKYNMWQLDPSGKLKDRMSWEGYESGHMMYLRKPDLSIANEHLREFIKNSTPKAGQAAKY